MSRISEHFLMPRIASVTVSRQTTTFVYHGDGNLVKKIKPDGSKTIYVGGIYEVDKTSGGTVTPSVLRTSPPNPKAKEKMTCMDWGHGKHPFGDIVYIFCRIGIWTRGGCYAVESDYNYVSTSGIC